MKSQFIRTLAIIVFALTPFILTGANCDPTAPGNFGLKPGEMNVTANVEGAFFATNTEVTDGVDHYIIRGSMRYAPIEGEIVVTIQVPKGEPPYTESAGVGKRVVIDYCLEESSNRCTTFHAGQGSGTGTVTITSVRPYVEGTFSGTLPSLTGTGSRILTGGEFKAPF